MALNKTYMTLTSKLLSRNSVALCIRYKHEGNENKERRDYPYLWRAKEKIPETPEEIAEAAARYNLHPSEYKPYKREDCRGDYPKLPLIGADARDPNYPWDYPTWKRNFGEPLHFVQDIIGHDRYSAGVREIITLPQAILMFGGTVAIYTILFIIGEYFPWFQPVMEKQYPKPGVTHYTFELAH